MENGIRSIVMGLCSKRISEYSVAFHCLYPFRIGNDNIDLIFQKIKDRDPVFTSGFHTDIMTVIVEKPLLEFEN